VLSLLVVLIILLIYNGENMCRTFAYTLLATTTVVLLHDQVIREGERKKYVSGALDLDAYDVATTRAQPVMAPPPQPPLPQQEYAPQQEYMLPNMPRPRRRMGGMRPALHLPNI
jgi:hypothetical protein